MRHRLAFKIAMTFAAAGLVFGAAACEADDGAVAPGQEEPAEDGADDGGDGGY